MLGERSDHRGLWGADSVYGPRLQGHLLRPAGITAGPAVPGRRVLLLRQPQGQRAAQPAVHCPAAPVPRQGQRRRGQGTGRLRHTVEKPDHAWAVALGIEAEDRPFAKSTLQVFRAQ